MVYEIDWIDPTKSDTRWNGRLVGAKSDTRWNGRTADPIKTDTRWNG